MISRRPEARRIFVQVNLDDELYEQEDEDNTSSELVFEEFVECIGRVAVERTDWSAKQEATLPFHAMFAAFLEQEFAPLTKNLAKQLAAGPRRL